MRRLCLPSFLLIASIQVCCIASAAQTYGAQSAAVIGAASAALGAGQPVSDITLTGTVTSFDGVKSDSGTATLKIKGADESRVDLALSSESRSEVRSLKGASPVGAGTHGNAPSQRQPLHNVLNPGSWASPIGVLAGLARPGSVVTYVGREQRLGTTVDHLQASYLPPSVHFPSEAAAASFHRLATFDLYLDASSHLPVAIAFNVHSDRDIAIDIPIQVTYSDYRNVNGVLVPYRIKRLIRGQLNLDLTISSVSLNSGLSDSDFAVQ